MVKRKPLFLSLPETKNGCMEKANLTLYTVIGDFNRVAESMRARFQEVTKMFTPEDDRYKYGIRRNRWPSTRRVWLIILREWKLL